MERIATPTNDQISELVESILNEKVKSVKPIKPGVRGKVFQISAGPRDYILKTSQQNFMLEREFLKLLSSNGIPVARMIATDADLETSRFNFSLMEKIDGENLYETPKKQWSKVLKQVGSKLKLIHAIPAKGYGRLNEQKLEEKGILEGKEASWTDYLKWYVFDDLAALRRKVEAQKTSGFKNSKLTKKQNAGLIEISGMSSKIEAMIIAGFQNFSFEPKFIYRDLHFDHIFVKGGELVGLIDFADPTIGDPLFDIGYFSVMPNGEYYPYLIEGWKGQFNEDRFHLYRLLISVEKLHTRYVEHDYLDKYPEIIDHALEELQR